MKVERTQSNFDVLFQGQLQCQIHILPDCSLYSKHLRSISFLLFCFRNNTLKRTKRTRKCATQKPNSNSHVTIICDQDTYWENQDLIYMNGDAVYTFGLKTILSYALLFHFDNYPIRVLRRILSIFAVLSVGCVLLFTRSVFFPFTLSNSYCKFEDCGYLMSYFTKNDYSYFMQYKATSAVYVPALLTVVQVICLFPILFKKQRLCEVLYWDEGNTALGQFMQQGKCLHSKYKSYSLETKLCKNFTTRLGYLVKRRFWVLFVRPFHISNTTVHYSCLLQKQNCEIF